MPRFRPLLNSVKLNWAGHCPKQWNECLKHAPVLDGTVLSARVCSVGWLRVFTAGYSHSLNDISFNIFYGYIAWLHGSKFYIVTSNIKPCLKWTLHLINSYFNKWNILWLLCIFSNLYFSIVCIFHDQLCICNWLIGENFTFMASSLSYFSRF